MQTEEFYRKIHERIEKTEFSPDFLEWNPESVWGRIEQKKHQPKTVFLWWRSGIAASIALATLVGGYFLSRNNDKLPVALNQAQNKNVAKSAELPSSKSELNEVKIPMKNMKDDASSESKYAVSNSENPTNEIERNLVDLENVQYLDVAQSETETIKHPLPATTIIAADSPKEKTLEAPKIEVELVDSQPFVVSPKFERTVVLDIPDTEEYNRFQRTEKKPFMARLFKQVGRFNTEGKVDWEELNVKPNRIWAYMKESMKAEKRETK